MFIDNSDPRALLELNLNPDGTQDGPIVRRHLVGLAAGALSDPEGIARVDTGAGFDLIVTSSLCVKSAPPPGKVHAHDGLVRIRYTPDGDLHADPMHGFRDWLIACHPALPAAAQLSPDQSGLNIEGVAWDPSRRALLFGVRSPVTAGRIPVLCVCLDTDAPWSTTALQPGPELSIEKSDFASPQGIRDIEYDSARQEFLVVLGRSLSLGTAPFQLCTWDGTASSVTVLDVKFEPSTMKPEGVAAIPGGGARSIVFVDDAGGFAVLNGA
ncbi:hypothetical protein [Rhodococcus tukisamuensis]|uniref:hypothetical protein n=1 Tax=Rhodococcus tukisamuensis TaxID=168276 RepID=UPI001113BE0A|nr:hypothetical protein [Rhodococcus tukisamuensis]